MLDLLPRTKVFRLIQTAPPPRPACFDSDPEWGHYLALCHASGERVVRRQDTGKYAGNRAVKTVLVSQAEALAIACEDCTPEHQKRMEAAGRCARPQTAQAAPTHCAGNGFTHPT